MIFSFHAWAALAILLTLPTAALAIEDEVGSYEANGERVAQAMVEEAMRAFEANRGNALSMMADPANPLFSDYNVYAFLVDGDGTFLTHTASPALVGTSAHDIADASGASLGNLLEDGSSPYGGWVSHSDPYPGSEYGGPIKTWIKAGWGYHFGASIHLNEDARKEIHMTERDRERQAVARAMAEEAIDAFQRNPDLAVSMIHNAYNALFHDAELFAIIIHENGTVVAHGDSPRLAGSDIDTLEDYQNANLGDVYGEVESVYGRWVEYQWPDPRSQSGGDELKFTWVKKSGEHKFAVGMYPEDPDTDDYDVYSIHDASRKDAAAEMIRATVRAFGEDVEEGVSLIHDGNDPRFSDSELYPIVSGPDGVVVAHGGSPEEAGSNIGDVEYGSGVALRDVFEKGSPYGSWVEHRGTHPESGRGVTQNTLVKYGGGYTFAVGTYPEYNVDLWPDVTREEKERMQTAQAMVARAAEAFAESPRATLAAVHDTADDLFRDGELFTVIIHTNGTILGHGYNPNIAGTDINNLRDSRGTPIGNIILDSASAYGMWVEYYWPNPVSASGDGEPQLAWYRMYGECLFGVGTYPASLN